MAPTRALRFFDHMTKRNGGSGDENDEWQTARKVQVPVLDSGGMFKDYDLHKVGVLSTRIEDMYALSFNYWLSKFVMEVAKKSG